MGQTVFHYGCCHFHKLEKIALETTRILLTGLVIYFFCLFFGFFFLSANIVVPNFISFRSDSVAPLRARKTKAAQPAPRHKWSSVAQTDCGVKPVLIAKVRERQANSNSRNAQSFRGAYKAMFKRVK